MKVFLRLKHWQLFTLTWGVSIALLIVSFNDLQLMMKLFPLMMLLFTTGIFGWVWAIATELHKKLPEAVTTSSLNVRQFRIYFSIPIAYILVLTTWLGFNMYGAIPDDSFGTVVGFIVFFHFLSMICIVFGLRFAAKTMKSVELDRLARFNDYAGEFFLIWMSPIGIWVLQPRLNKLVD